MSRARRTPTSVAIPITADHLIPAVPVFRWFPAAPPAAQWREAMRWALIGLTASLAAGEITLWLTLG